MYNSQELSFLYLLLLLNFRVHHLSIIILHHHNKRHNPQDRCSSSFNIHPVAMAPNVNIVDSMWQRPLRIPETAVPRFGIEDFNSVFTSGCDSGQCVDSLDFSYFASREVWKLKHTNKQRLIYYYVLVYAIAFIFTCNLTLSYI